MRLAIVFAVLLFGGNLFVPHLNYPEKLITALIICGGFVVVLIYPWLNWRFYSTDLERNIALASKGQLDVVVYKGRTGSALSRAIYLNNIRFRTDRTLFQLLTKVAEEDPPCVIYYTPKSKIILSLEILNRAKRV